MHTVLASVLAALHGSRSWWNRPMVWASLGAIAYGGRLAVRRSQRRAAREAAADEETAAPAPVEGCDRMDEAMNRLGRDWRPEHEPPTDAGPWE